MSSRATRSQTHNQRTQIQIESSLINECGVFSIAEVDYDGNCLFSSIFNFIEQNRGRFKDVPQSINQIRARAVDYILSRNSIGFQTNWDRFYGNIKFNLEARIKCLGEYGKDNKRDATIRQAYQHYMTKPGNFGTFSELTAAAEFYGFIVHIFQHDENNDFTCYEAGSTDNHIIDRKKPVLFLLFTGPTDAGHFRPLIPSIAPTVIISGKYQASGCLPTSNQQVSKITIKKSQERTTGKSSSVITTSNLNATDTQSFSCDICKRSFPTKRGLASHRTIHAQDNASKEPTVSRSEPNKTTQPEFTCDVCKQTFPTKRGLTVHRSRHAKEANETTAAHIKERLNATALTNSSSTRNNDAIKSRSALDSECDKFKKSFESF